MGYNKYIKSGKQYEFYEFEQDLSLSRIKRKSEILRGQSVRVRTFEFGEGDVKKEVRTLFGQALEPRNFTLVSGEQNLAVDGVVALQQSEPEKKGKRRDNAQRASMAFGRLVRSNLDGVENPILATFTYKENVRDFSYSARTFNLFIQRLRRRFGSGFRYIAVPEFQKRGAIHYHALFWGLPVGLVHRERQTRELANTWGQGFVDVLLTDGDKKISYYLAKYMVKALKDERLTGKKAYFASRNVKRPLLVKNVFDVSFVLRDIGLDGAEPEYSKKFSTPWLGECSYRVYNT